MKALIILLMSSSAWATYFPQTVIMDQTNGHTAGVNASSELDVFLNTDSNVCKETGGNLASILSELEGTISVNVQNFPVPTPTQSVFVVNFPVPSPTVTVVGTVNANIVSPSPLPVHEVSPVPTQSVSVVNFPVPSPTITVQVAGPSPLPVSVQSGQTEIVDGSNSIVGPVIPINGINRLPVVQSGRGVSATFTQSYSGSNLSTSAYTTIITSTSGTINAIDVLDTSGGLFYLSYASSCGSLSSSSNSVIIGLGGGEKDFQIPSAQCVGFQAIGSNIISGSVYMTFYK